MGVVVDHWWSWNWWTTYWVGAQLWQSFQSLFQVTEYNSFAWIVIISLVVFFQGLKKRRPQEWMKKNKNGAWILTFLKVSRFGTKLFILFVERSVGFTKVISTFELFWMTWKVQKIDQSFFKHWHSHENPRTKIWHHFLQT